MRPLTDTMPKPMVPVNGRPFLDHLIGQMREQGVRRVLLLSGYRGEMIRQHFGDGERHGLVISYSHGPVEWETGRRLWEARPQIDGCFLLLYSDNFAPFNLEKLLGFHRSRPAAISLQLRPKGTGNIQVRPDGMVGTYDPSRTTAGLDHVEIGYMLVERDAVFALFDHPDVSFSRILQRLVQDGRLAGMTSGDPYHSVSDPVRWKLAERYLAEKRILLIDRDGTINRRPPRGTYVTQWQEFNWVDETVQAMRQLAAAGIRFIVLSNQAGIARGMVTAEAVAAINRQMVAELRAQQVEVIATYVCPHHWDDGCDCRKPAPGMFFQVAREHLLRIDRTAYVGDDVRDCLAADNAGCLSVMIGPERNQCPPDGPQPDFGAETLPEAVPWLIERFAAWEQ